VPTAAAAAAAANNATNGEKLTIRQLNGSSATIFVD
jgi:hypothetical protein